VQKTCCEGDPWIILTLRDVERIAAHTGRSDFVVNKHYPDLSFMQRFAYDPNWQKYTVRPGNMRRQVRATEQGACHFLGAAGCELPTSVRPLVCRLFPYNYNEYGIIGIYSGADLMCPVHLLEDGISLARDLGVGMIEQVDAWRTTLYRELRAEWRNSRNAVRKRSAIRG
jgi:Fe-S-cluster containining protein